MAISTGKELGEALKNNEDSTAAPAAGVVGFGAVSVLGLSAATSAVAIAIAADGVGAATANPRTI